MPTDTATKFCTECGTEIPNPHGNRKTCSDKCRGARSRRQRKLGNPSTSETAQAIEPMVRSGELARDVLREELRPIVREAITQDVLNAIGGMIRLTPRAVELLSQDLESEDANIRQRAQTLLFKYTVGNPTVAPTVEAAPPAFVVNFEMPRPGDQGDSTEQDAVLRDADVVEEETRECHVCHSDKHPSEFVGNSDRCTACHEQIKSRALPFQKEDG